VTRYGQFSVGQAKSYFKLNSYRIYAAWFEWSARLTESILMLNQYYLASSVYHGNQGYGPNLPYPLHAAANPAPPCICMS
jgi:hypothetical protein